jgi:phage regulator Rha-like protein
MELANINGSATPTMTSLEIYEVVESNHADVWREAYAVSIEQECVVPAS